MLNWTTTPEEYAAINAVAHRAIEMKLYEPTERLRAAMDLTAVHKNGCPLRLADMITGHRFDFAHDINGIRQHLDHETGKLGDGFLPRFAASDAPAAHSDKGNT